MILFISYFTFCIVQHQYFACLSSWYCLYHISHFVLFNMLFSNRLFRMGENDYLFDNPIWKSFSGKEKCIFFFLVSFWKIELLGVAVLANIYYVFWIKDSFRWNRFLPPRCFLTKKIVYNIITHTHTHTQSGKRLLLALEPPYSSGSSHSSGSSSRSTPAVGLTVCVCVCV